MSKKIGFIGCGNMGSAMVGGLIKSGFVTSDDIIVSTKTEASSKRLEDEFKIEASDEIISSITTVGNIVEYIAELKHIS